MKINLLIIIGLLFSLSAISQIENYNYIRNLQKPTEQWHKIVIPDEIYNKVNQNLSDVRIFGISVDGDTIEAPFIIGNTKDKVVNRQIDFIAINNSKNENGYFFTFEMEELDIINKIELRFAQKNYNWLIKLEGSQNQRDWYTILDNYRILSISNGYTNYQFTSLAFENSKFNFYRIFIETSIQPNLLSTKILDYSIEKGVFMESPIASINAWEDKNKKQTQIDIDLERPLPVSVINIDVADTFDYYRPIIIKYLMDSVQSEMGMIYNYQTLIQATLNSMESNSFKLGDRIIQKIRLIINNESNQPLSINKISIKHNINELYARFTVSAAYYMVYGNDAGISPNYDIHRFKNNVPENIITLNIEDEQIIPKIKKEAIHPIFENEKWLWAIMIMIIAVLGWFSIIMIRKI